MGIIQPLTEQHAQTALGTNLSTMHSLKAYETAIGSETKVGVGTSQTRQGVERHTVDSNEDGRREAGLRIEFNPVRVMVIGHIDLNYPLSLNHSHLYT
jgi:hypothetical protein